jgi:hypothetical protein
MVKLLVKERLIIVMINSITLINLILMIYLIIKKMIIEYEQYFAAIFKINFKIKFIKLTIIVFIYFIMNFRVLIIDDLNLFESLNFIFIAIIIFLFLSH